MIQEMCAPPVMLFYSLKKRSERDRNEYCVFFEVLLKYVILGFEIVS